MFSQEPALVKNLTMDFRVSSGNSLFILVELLKKEKHKKLSYSLSSGQKDYTHTAKAVVFC